MHHEQLRAHSEMRQLNAHIQKYNTWNKQESRKEDESHARTFRKAAVKCAHSEIPNTKYENRKSEERLQTDAHARAFGNAYSARRLRKCIFREARSKMHIRTRPHLQRRPHERDRVPLLTRVPARISVRHHPRMQFPMRATQYANAHPAAARAPFPNAIVNAPHALSHGTRHTGCTHAEGAPPFGKCNCQCAACTQSRDTAHGLHTCGGGAPIREVRVRVRARAPHARRVHAEPRDERMGGRGARDEVVQEWHDVVSASAGEAAVRTHHTTAPPPRHIRECISECPPPSHRYHHHTCTEAHACAQGMRAHTRMRTSHMRSHMHRIISQGPTHITTHGPTHSHTHHNPWPHSDTLPHAHITNHITLPHAHLLMSPSAESCVHAHGRSMPPPPHTHTHQIIDIHSRQCRR